MRFHITRPRKGRVCPSMSRWMRSVCPPSTGDATATNMPSAERLTVVPRVITCSRLNLTGRQTDLRRAEVRPDYRARRARRRSEGVTLRPHVAFDERDRLRFRLLERIADELERAAPARSRPQHVRVGNDACPPAVVRRRQEHADVLVPERCFDANAPTRPLGTGCAHSPGQISSSSCADPQTEQKPCEATPSPMTTLLLRRRCRPPPGHFAAVPITRQARMPAGRAPVSRAEQFRSVTGVQGITELSLGKLQHEFAVRLRWSDELNSHADRTSHDHALAFHTTFPFNPKRPVSRSMSTRRSVPGSNGASVITKRPLSGDVAGHRGEERLAASELDRQGPHLAQGRAAGGSRLSPRPRLDARNRGKIQPVAARVTSSPDMTLDERDRPGFRVLRERPANFKVTAPPGAVQRTLGYVMIRERQRSSGRRHEHAVRLDAERRLDGNAPAVPLRARWLGARRTVFGLDVAPSADRTKVSPTRSLTALLPRIYIVAAS